MPDGGWERKIRILLVEDTDGDVRLLKEAMAEGTPWCDITRAENGAQASDMLFQRGKYKGSNVPTSSCST